LSIKKEINGARSLSSKADILLCCFTQLYWSSAGKRHIKYDTGDFSFDNTILILVT